MRRDEFAFKSIYIPIPDFAKREEAILSIGKELNEIFNDALQCNFEKFEEKHLSIWEDLFSWQFSKKERYCLLSALCENGEEAENILNDKLKTLEEIKEDLQDIESLEEELECMCNYDDDGNLLIDENGYLINGNYDTYDINEGYCGANTLDDYENLQNDIYNLKADFPEDVKSYDCLFFINYVKALRTYIEDGLLPDAAICRITTDLGLYKRMLEDKSNRAIAAKFLFDKIDNHKAKAGLEYLFDKGLIIYNNGLLEIDKEKCFVNRGKGGTMVAFICAYLFGYTKELKLIDASKKQRVVYDTKANKQTLLNKILVLFGESNYNQAKDFFKRDKNKQNEADCFQAPENSIEVYNIMLEFEREYESQQTLKM